MSLILQMLHKNVPLSQWKTFDASGPQGYGFFSSKKNDNVAREIFRQLSHDAAVELVAREFNQLSPDLRMTLRTLCNDANGSGNVRKGVQRLDRLLNGKLLRDADHMEHFQVKTRDGWKTTRVNQAVAGATRKYGIVRS